MKNGGLSTRNFVIVLFRFNIYNGARPSETVPAGTQVILYSKFYASFQYVVGSMHDNWKNNFHFPPRWLRAQCMQNLRMLDHQK